MPAITATNMAALGAVAVTETTLDGSTDTFVYNSAAKPLLVLRNATGGALTPVIDGDAAVAIPVKDAAANFDATAGYSVGSIAAGDSVSIRLETISAYLLGTISITSGTGIEASLLEF